MNFKRILVAVNSLDSRDAAFNRALALAQSSGAELYVLCAHSLHQPFSLAAKRLERMAGLRRRARAIGVRVQTVEQHGDPAEIIELHANGREADLIVIGGEARRAWSLVAERVLRGTSVPTLVVASDGPGIPTAFRNVLVAVDLSPASKDVLSAAVAVTGDQDVELTVMHTVSGIEAAHAVQSRLVPGTARTYLQDARRALGVVVSAAPARLGTRLEVSIGSSAPTILDHAADLNADLVVLVRTKDGGAESALATRAVTFTTPEERCHERF